ncbi:putative sulfate exporter family transporter [Desulfothermobacter acidiphilus]|uniref:putative sulfate exporter family transporter n=1 Tax=Desulfothermobacter acidiphilus TaxID=1938353 RepID=UPI003F8A3739
MEEIVCKPATPKSPFVTSEDWWSVYLGIFFLLMVFLAFITHLANPDVLKSAMPVEWPQKNLLNHLVSNFPAYLLLYVLLTALTTIAARAMGEDVVQYIAGFTVLFLGAFLVLILGSQQTLKLYGLEYPFWSLVLGLIVGNLVTLPRWLRAASDHTEFYIKMGIVLLGAALPFTTIVKGGVWGFLEAALIRSCQPTVGVSSPTVPGPGRTTKEDRCSGSKL